MLIPKILIKHKKVVELGGNMYSGVILSIIYDSFPIMKSRKNV